jgi:hypothetical protein
MMNLRTSLSRHVDADLLYSSWKALEGEKKVSAVDVKDKDKKAAEMLRRASIGTLNVPRTRESWIATVGLSGFFFDG